MITDRQNAVLNLVQKYKYITSEHLVLLKMFESSEQARKQALTPLLRKGILKRERVGRSVGLHRMADSEVVNAGYFAITATVELWIKLDAVGIEFTPFFGCEKGDGLSLVRHNDKIKAKVDILLSKWQIIRPDVYYVKPNNSEINGERIYNLDDLYQYIVNKLSI